MKWVQLVPYIKQQLARYSLPDVLIVHLGSNDMVQYGGDTLGDMITKDLAEIHKLLPNTKIVWSEILPRLRWEGANSWVGIENKRRRVNRYGLTWVGRNGGFGIKHEITHKDKGLFRADQVHLSDIGNDIFLNSIQECLEVHLK